MSIRKSMEKANYMKVSGNYSDYGNYLIDLCNQYLKSNSVTLEGLENFNSFMPEDPRVIDEPENSKCLDGVKKYKETILKPYINEYKNSKENEINSQKTM